MAEQSLQKQQYLIDYRLPQSTGFTPESVDGEKNMLKQKHKEQAGIIVKTLDAQISKRQQYVNAERKRKEDHEKKINEDNKEYLETRKSVQKEWK